MERNGAEIDMMEVVGVLMPDADDELADGAVMLHVLVGLRHLLQAVVDAVHGEGQPAGRDRVEGLLEGLPRQVGGVAEVAACRARSIRVFFACQLRHAGAQAVDVPVGRSEGEPGPGAV
jgi:hypothetical protein